MGQIPDPRRQSMSSAIGEMQAIVSTDHDWSTLPVPVKTVGIQVLGLSTANILKRCSRDVWGY
jgi:hypothetical protein